MGLNEKKNSDLPIVSILIPCYNEASTVAQVIQAIKETNLASLGVQKEIMLIDDGSSDQTASIARRFDNVRVIELPENRGKGWAIRQGLAEASGDYILIQDADLEYSPSDYPALLAPLIAGTVDVVYGSRFLKRCYPRQMRVTHFLANKLLTWTLNRLFAARLTDEATCYKAFRTDLLRSLALTAERFEFCPEVTAKLLQRKISIIEVPIDYRARSAKEGKKIQFSDGIQALRTMVNVRRSSVTRLET